MFLSTVIPSAKAELLSDEIFTEERKPEIKDVEFLNYVTQKQPSTLKDKEWRKLKTITRNHVHTDLREKLWMWITGGQEFLDENPTFYQETTEERFHDDTIAIIGQQEVISYYLTTEGGNQMCKIIYMIKYHHPEITFCPLLEPIVAILLHFLEEEKVYACVIGMLTNKVIQYFDQTKSSNIVSDATFQDLIKHTNKHAYQRLESFISPNTEQKKTVLLPLWKSMIFESLEFVSLVRLLDCFMMEGNKILYRTGLYLVEIFYKYSLTFRKLHASSPHDLVTTIGQHASSLKLSPLILLKASNEIDITTKKIHSYTEDNLKLYKSNKMDYSEEVSLNQVVAIDLNKVSDIITPNQWQDVCQWLPLRIQVLQPFLLFTTNKHGYNLKTLYDMCEDEEQTLLIIQTTSHEVFGAYLSRPLVERFDGHNCNSYFGTGETFIFKLSPTTFSYHWNQDDVKEAIKSRKRKYIFVDTVEKLNLDEKDALPKTKSFSRTRSFKKSIKRSFSHHNFSKRSQSKRESYQQNAYPLSSINIRKNTISVPKNMYLGNLRNIDFSATSTSMERRANEIIVEKRKKFSADKAITFDVGFIRGSPSIDENNVFVEKTNSFELKNDHMTRDDHSSYDVVDHKDIPSPKKPLEKQSSTLTAKSVVVEYRKPAEMFICGDDKRLVIGGGNGDALYIDHELNKGRSVRCDTFFNAPLTSCEDGDFTITRIDVFAFQLV